MASCIDHDWLPDISGLCVCHEKLEDERHHPFAEFSEEKQHQ